MSPRPGQHYRDTTTGDLLRVDELSHTPGDEPRATITLFIRGEKFGKQDLRLRHFEGGRYERVRLGRLRLWWAKRRGRR